MMLSFHEEEEGLPDSFLSNFPSLIKVDIHAKVTDPSVAKSMMGCLLSSLKANGRWQLPSVMTTMFIDTTCARYRHNSGTLAVFEVENKQAHGSYLDLM